MQRELARGNIESRTMLKLSAMPEGLVSNLTAAQVADLLAFRNVVPCIAGFCPLVVPTSRLDWQVPRYQRASCSPWLVNGLADLVNRLTGQGWVV